MRALALLLCLLTAACGSSDVRLTYVGTAGPSAGARPVVAVPPVADARGQADVRWIGTIRGGYGNPLKSLNAPGPVAEEVRQALSDGLARRGLLAPAAGQYELRATMRALNANRYVRQEANVEVSIELADRASGRVLYTDVARVNRVEGSILAFDTGVFASVEGLRDVAARALSEAVDQLLDKPGFRSAIGARGVPIA